MSHLSEDEAYVTKCGLQLKIMLFNNIVLMIFK